MIDQTRWSMTEIAFRAGFRSLRRFNVVFLETYGRPPSKVRSARPRAG
jgi:AraC family transcriptional regulator, regulatory protein of adaptative response / methylated-DNA-[protein]-cysteine methyltransferase